MFVNMIGMKRQICLTYCTYWSIFPKRQTSIQKCAMNYKIDVPGLHILWMSVSIYVADRHNQQSVDEHAKQHVRHDRS